MRRMLLAMAVAFTVVLGVVPYMGPGVAYADDDTSYPLWVVCLQDRRDYLHH